MTVPHAWPLLVPLIYSLRITGMSSVPSKLEPNAQVPSCSPLSTHPLSAPSLQLHVVAQRVHDRLLRRRSQNLGRRQLLQRAEGGGVHKPRGACQEGGHFARLDAAGEALLRG